MNAVDRNVGFVIWIIFWNMLTLTFYPIPSNVAHNLRI